MVFWVAFVIWVSAARAEIPLPSYPEVAARAAWFEADALFEAGRYEEAIAYAEAWERTVRETSGLEYLIGLSYRFLDDTGRAERHLRRATELDPMYAAPWGDLGELYLVQGRYDEARPCFEMLTTLRPSGPGASTGPRRLAEIAAHQGDPDAFEDHIREALRRGFSFREIEGLPTWQKFYADPRLRDAIVKMVTVYGDKRVLDTLVPRSTAKNRP